MRHLRPLLWLSICCVLNFALACGDDDEEATNGNGETNQQNQNQNQEDPPPEPPDDPQELCEAACAAIYDEDGCDDFFVYPEEDGGGAMSEDVCVDRCLEDNKFRGGQWCVATEAECSEDLEEMIEFCLPDDYHHPHCSDLGLWPREFEELESRTVELLNDARREGIDCGGESLGPVDEVQMHDALHCAARLHSVDMVEDEFFSTIHPETQYNTQDRILAAGYEPTEAGGLVTAGELTAEQVVQGWIDDHEHCETIMGAEFEDVGIGRYEFERWTLKLAANGE